MNNQFLSSLIGAAAGSGGGGGGGGAGLGNWMMRQSNQASPDFVGPRY
jgi:hypothetical protein